MSAKAVENSELESVEENAAAEARIRRAFWISSSVIAFIAMASIVAVVYFQMKKPEIKTVVTKDKSATKRVKKVANLPRVAFSNITQQAGIDFVHTSGMTKEKFLPETMGSGVAFFDYDNDGDSDLFFVNGNDWPEHAKSDQPPPTMRLYENSGKGAFKDVSEECGLAKTFFGMGVAVGDFDNDGWRDLFVSAVGKNHLFKNVQGKFIDVTDDAGVGGGEADWGTSCGWFDYDKDGLLDLVVGNYIKWSKEIDINLHATLNGRDRAYAPPRFFQGAFPYLYHNLGNGKFEEVSEKAGMWIRNPNTQVPQPKPLGIAVHDFNNDGWDDIFFACDTVRNLLFLNQKDGTFKEQGESMGVAFDSSGTARGAMGIDVARFRNDSATGIVIGNFANEPCSMLVQRKGANIYTDDANVTGIGPQTRSELTFGVFFFDYDLDGRLDLMTANGHLENEINSIHPSQFYEQAPHLFWAAGQEADTEFESVPTKIVGEDFTKPMVGRGASFADIDQDGDLDVVISACGQQPRLLRNDSELGNHWLRVQLQQPEKNLDAIGSLITLKAGGMEQFRTVSTTFSYLSQRELPVTFGLGKTDKIDSLEITWPDGAKQVLENVKADQLLVVKRDAPAK
jgi:enediyne biosynthesis protein E4